MAASAVGDQEMNDRPTVQHMSRSRAFAAMALVAALVLTACDDGPPGASVGNPEAGATVTGASDLAYPTYVALGDSYTAAPGVPQTEQETGCLRSNGNYASLVANQLESDFVDVSCSGATTVSLVGAQHTGVQVLPAAVRRPVRGHLAGHPRDRGQRPGELFQTMVGTCGRFALGDPDGSPCRDYMKDARQEEGPAGREDRQDR